MACACLRCALWPVGPAAAGFVEFDPEPAGRSTFTEEQFKSPVAELPMEWRKAFLRKVFGILGMQIFTTVVISSLMMIYGGLDLIIWSSTSGSWTVFTSMIGSFILLMATLCYRHKAPVNMLLLALFTLCESYCVGIICTSNAASGMASTVIEAFALTSVLFLSLIAFTMFSKIDFDFLGPVLFVVLMAFFWWGFFGVVFFNSFAFSQIYALIGVIIFSLFVVYDVHTIMKNLSFDEYILGAINLYLDFINLFLFILELLTGRGGE